MPLVLVVDDDEDCRIIFPTALTRAGFTVVSAVNGAQALQLARSQKPDVVLLDLAMPEMHGLDVLAELKADPDLARVPVLAVTASRTEHDRQDLLAAGFADVLIKPVIPRALIDATETWSKGVVMGAGDEAPAPRVRPSS